MTVWVSCGNSDKYYVLDWIFLSQIQTFFFLTKAKVTKEEFDSEIWTAVDTSGLDSSTCENEQTELQSVLPPSDGNSGTIVDCNGGL